VPVYYRHIIFDVTLSSTNWHANYRQLAVVLSYAGFVSLKLCHYLRRRHSRK